VDPRITVVGLGPGDRSLLTVGTVDAIASSRHRFLRTRIHPSASAVPDAESFDHLYERFDTFAQVYQAVVDTLLRTVAEVGELLYAVPGSPAVAEHTVELLIARAPTEGVVVEVVPALSFADLAWARLAIDPMADPVTLIDGHRFVDDIAGRRGPFLVAQCHSRDVLSEIKLVLSGSVLEPDLLPPITVLHHLGLPDERILRVHWSKLDQSVDADHLTSLYIPGLAARVGVSADRLWQLMARLRADCPWNEEQTATSLAPYAVEEAGELVEAVALLDATLADPEADPQPAIDHYRQELGDVLYQVLFHSAVAVDEGWFGFDDVIATLHDKLVRRHPHIFPRDDFDPGAVSSSADVVRNWERIKAMERAAKAAGSAGGP
jgi:tetrapyrrole methylase family protein / MazG family protein